MKQSIALVLSLILSTSGMAQQSMHTPAEILTMMEKSEISYLLRSTDDQISEFDYSHLNTNYYFQVETESGLDLQLYALSHEDSVTFSKGERALKNGKLDNARDRYLEVLKNNPNFAAIMAYIGQTYDLQDEPKKARTWYLKAIEENYCDYMAHWLYADVERRIGDMDIAVREVTTAYVLNRNNPRILASLKDIYKAAKLKFQEWEFEPNYRLIPAEDPEKAQVTVVFDEPWMTYGLYKSIWAYEPGYRFDMTGSDSELSLFEERECLAGMLIMATGKDGKFKGIKAIPALTYVYKSLQSDLLTEFILMEIWLRRHPIIAYTQTRETIESLVGYVVKVRGEKL
jgi:tetratricopeptide (TPR) repeat protein